MSYVSSPLYGSKYNVDCETTAPVSKGVHLTIEQANKSRQPEKNTDTSIQILMESLILSNTCEGSECSNNSS